jgi:hypothetical protein
MKKKNMRRFLIVVVVLALIPTQSVQADMAPKPSMIFKFIFETDSPLQITDGDLMVCEDAACSQVSSFEELDTNILFRCDLESCSSFAYGYPEHQFYLKISFSNGETWESNLFGKEHYQAYYEVTVRENDLVVEEIGGRNNPMGYFWGGLFIIGGLAIGLVITLVMIVAKGKGEESGEGVKRVWFIVAWVIGILLLLVGGMFTLTIPLTGAIELLLGWLYTHWRDRRKRVVLTMILIARWKR